VFSTPASLKILHGPASCFRFVHYPAELVIPHNPLSYLKEAMCIRKEVLVIHHSKQLSYLTTLAYKNSPDKFCLLQTPPFIVRDYISDHVKQANNFPFYRAWQLSFCEISNKKYIQMVGLRFWQLSPWGPK